jgi:stage II sporulation protein D
MRVCASCAATELNGAIAVRAAGDALSIGRDRNANSISVTGSFTVTAHGESLRLENLLRIAARKGELVVAVTLPIETYVERVVASESSTADGPESLKALAIVVRSFALHQAHGHADYDLCDSTHCQLLHWTASKVRPAAHAATLATSGETLWYHGSPVAAWFHQNCGGRTASPSEVWPESGRARAVRSEVMPWLIGHDDPYCTAGGARQWSTTLSLADLTAALSAAGLARPGWKTLVVGQRGESGRAVMLRVGETEVSGEAFRLAVGRALGWNRILSTWFEVSSQGNAFIFHGRGSGHGVGLCQAGAAAMSALGKSSSEILAQYFPGAQAEDEATGQPWQNLRGTGFTLETLTPADAAYLPQLAQAFDAAQSVSGLHPSQSLTIRAFRSTPAFRDATLAPGWVAAFTEGDLIATQPLSTLAARGLLAPVLRHEFLHALVEAQAAHNTPLWLREGLVEVWSDPAQAGKTASRAATVLNLEQTEFALAHSKSEGESTKAHRAAAWHARQLLDRYGRAQVLGWLQSGLPANAIQDAK